MFFLFKIIILKTIHQPKYLEIIALLIKARKDKGLTQVNVAKALGKPQSYIAKIERCERKLDVLEFLDLCGILEKNPCTIIQQITNGTIGKQYNL